MSINVKFTQLKDDMVVPTAATSQSAAYDLYSTEDFILEPNQTKLVPLGFATHIPLGWCALICPRSGLALKKGITIPNSPGIIDSDYRNEWGVILHNISNIAVEFSRGDRIAQALFQEISVATFQLVKNLTVTKRQGGFGSTGK